MEDKEKENVPKKSCFWGHRWSKWSQINDTEGNTYQKRKCVICDRSELNGLF